MYLPTVQLCHLNNSTIFLTYRNSIVSYFVPLLYPKSGFVKRHYKISNYGVSNSFRYMYCFLFGVYL